MLLPCCLGGYPGISSVQSECAVVGLVESLAGFETSDPCQVVVSDQFVSTPATAQSNVLMSAHSLGKLMTQSLGQVGSAHWC